MANKLKIGIIGESPGNGHPFSWSAIFNGYNKEKMEKCGYPVIQKYLQEQNWPSATLKKAKIVSVWTQDIERSKLIADASNIPHVCSNLHQIYNEVDAIILARDDAHNHIKYSLPAIKKGLPIFIDKPLAINTDDAKYLFSQATNSILFSCSSMRYDCDLDISSWWKSPEVNHLLGMAPKQWETYSIHAIEPILYSYQKCFNYSGEEILNIISRCSFTSFRSNKTVKLELMLPRPKNLKPVKVEIQTTGNDSQPIQIFIYNQANHLLAKKTHLNTFTSFKSTLKAFEDSLFTKIEPIERQAMLSSVLMVEKGLCKT